MEWLIENWYVIVGLMATTSFITYKIVVFIKMPHADKRQLLMSALQGMVAEAERELGKSTGVLKLRKVYSQALAVFPWIAEVYTFEQFEGLVNQALDWMKEQASKNPAFKEYIELNYPKEA